MGEFFSYTIEASLIMFMMAMAYRWLLSSDNQPAFNRVVLLSIYAMSFLVPIFCATWFRAGIDVSIEAMAASGPVVPDSGTGHAVMDIWRFITISLICVYVAGVLVLLLRTVLAWFQLIRIIKAGRRESVGEYQVIVTDSSGYSPFSWFRYVVMSESDYDHDRSVILTHELKHLSLCHYVDMMISQLSVIFLWYTPAPWLMRDELRAVHEYQADMAVIKSGVDVRAYQLLLIKKAAGKKFQALANSLNHSKLKKRITMMMKKQTGGLRRMRVLAMAPVLALAFAIINVPTVSAALDNVRNVKVVDKDSNKTVAGHESKADVRKVVVTVNGKEISNEAMSKLNPSTIQSVTVLKSTQDSVMIICNDCADSVHRSATDMSDVRVVSVGTKKKGKQVKASSVIVSGKAADSDIYVNGQLINKDSSIKSLSADSMSVNYSVK